MFPVLTAIVRYCLCLGRATGAQYTHGSDIGIDDLERSRVGHK